MNLNLLFLILDLNWILKWNIEGLKYRNTVQTLLDNSVC